MLIFTAKLPRRKTVLSGILLAVLSFTLVLLGLNWGQIRAVSANIRPNPKGIKSNEDRIAYLSQWGWQVADEPLSVQELLIPKEMDSSYLEYLTMQQAQGFDLSKYAGKRVKRYTYQVTNYPTGEDGVQANLLIFRHTVVGGEILSPSWTVSSMGWMGRLPLLQKTAHKRRFYKSICIPSPCGAGNTCRQSFIMWTFRWL